MLRLSLVHARPGMVLAMPVPHPRQASTVLLRAGAALTDHTIDRLRELRVMSVWIRYPGLEDMVRFVSPAIENSYRDLVVLVGSALDKPISQSSIDLDFYEYKRAVMSLVDELVANPHAAMFVSSLAGGDAPFMRHSGNVCVLSLLMGLKLDFYLVRERARLSAHAAKDLSGLGVGAMFHDIGMPRLDAPVLDRWNRHADESDPQWQRHVHIGFDMVKSDLDPAAASVVLNHHQKFDGAGFPCRPQLGGECVQASGSDIHIFARIAACADMFDRLCYAGSAPGAAEEIRPAMPVVRALKRMLAPPFTRWIDPVVFRALLAVSPPYPPGTVVTLSNGRTAVVVDWSPCNPCRPTIEIIDDLDSAPRSDQRPRERIDLRTTPDLHVIRADGFDVASDNFYPASDEEYDLARIGKALTNRADSLQSVPSRAHG